MREAIRRTARDLARERMPVGHLRELRDRRDPLGMSRDVWREMARLGLVGLAVPEAYGGAGLGMVELGIVMEELGRCLAPTAMLSTAVLGAGALLRGGDEEKRRALLPGVCAGERILALALDEGTRHDPAAIRARAERFPDGWRLFGEKSFVLDGHAADTLVVAALAGDRVTLFLVPAAARGLELRRLELVDSRNAARVRLDGVEVPEDALLGGGEILEPVLQRGAAALAAEMLGGACEAFDRTVDYLKVRRQFGVQIGSFQALKHRAAWMYGELVLVRALVEEALQALDAGRSDAAPLCSAAKAKASEIYLHVAGEAIQMHGGIGVTDEHEIGLFYKRARAAEMTLGGAAYHRDRFARLRA